MEQFSVNLTVDIEQPSPAEAAQFVADMADGWTYEVFGPSGSYLVHLEAGKEPVVEEL